MTHTALIVLEILIGVATLGGAAHLLIATGPKLAGGQGAAALKMRIVVDLVILDAIAALQFIAAWQVISYGSLSRTLSIVAGMVVAVAAAARPTLSGSRQGISSVFVLLGLAVILLGVVSPAPG
jgi:hypothetical protein